MALLKNFFLAACLFMLTGFALAGTAPTVSVTSQTAGTYLKNGTANITFTVTDVDNPADFNAALYYSTSAGAKANKIADMNLLVTDPLQTNKCSSTTFTSASTCTYSWALSLADGNYFIDVQASDLNNSDSTTASSAPFAVDNNAPSQVAGLSATAGDAQVSLSWTASSAPDFNAYYVYTNSSLSGTLTTTSFTKTALTNGTSYTFMVKAVDRAGNLGADANVSSTPQAAVVSGKPEISSSTHSEDGSWVNNESPSFTWTPATNAVKYRYALTDSPDTVPDASLETAERAKSYSGIAEGEKWFHVRACDANGNCGETDHYRIRVDKTSPGPVANIISISQSDASIYLSWDPPSDISGIKEFIVYRSVQQKFGERDFLSTDPDVKKVSGITTASYTDQGGLAVGQAYYYRIQAVDGAGNNSSISSVQKAVNSTNSCQLEISSNLPEYAKAGSLAFKLSAAPGISGATLRARMPGKDYEKVLENKGGTEIEAAIDVPLGIWGKASVQVEGRDSHGNRCKKEFDFVADSIGPKAEIIAPALGEKISGQYKITAKISDEGSGIANAEALINGEKIGGLSESAGTYSLDWDSGSKTEGRYTLTIKAEDKAGNGEGTEIGIVVGGPGGEVFAENEESYNAQDVRSLLENAGLREELISEAERIVEKNPVKRKLSIMRTPEGMKATITLSLRNPGAKKRMYLVEVIPKEVAQNAAWIESPTPFVVLEQDPVVSFELGEVGEGEEAQVSYSIAGKLTEEEANMVAEGFAKFAVPPLALETEANANPFKAAAAKPGDNTWMVLAAAGVIMILFAVFVGIGAGTYILHKRREEKGGFSPPQEPTKAEKKSEAQSPQSRNK